MNRERLSAFMDDQRLEQTLINELEQDLDSVQTWKNYHLIGDVMRGDMPLSTQWDIAARVAHALDREAPLERFYESSVEKEMQPTPVKARLSLPKWLNSFGQVAVAACVTFVIIVSVQQFEYDAPGFTTAKLTTNNAINQLPVLQTVPVAGSVEPVSLSRDNVPSRTKEAQLLEQHRRINAMLQDYELQLRLNSSVAKKTSVSTLPHQQNVSGH